MSELTVAGALRHNRVFEHAVLDIDLPDGNGVALAVQLVHQHRVNSIVFFTATRDATDLSHAAQLGLVVDKAAGAERLLQAIEQLERTSVFPQPAFATSEPESRTLFDLGSSDPASLRAS
jgi:response regulator of citrate/malate metabolism